MVKGRASFETEHILRTYSHTHQTTDGCPIVIVLPQGEIAPAEPSETTLAVLRLWYPRVNTRSLLVRGHSYVIEAALTSAKKKGMNYMSPSLLKSP